MAIGVMPAEPQVKCEQLDDRLTSTSCFRTLRNELSILKETHRYAAPDGDRGRWSQVKAPLLFHPP